MKHLKTIFGGGCRRAADAAVPHWTCLRRHRRVFVALAAIALLCSGAATLKRIVLQRADLSALAVRTLSPGELVYIVNSDGTISLRVGDGETVYGLIPSDPASPRIASQRVLDPSTDYYVETYGGAIANANASYTIPAEASASGGVRIVSLTLPISSVEHASITVTEADKEKYSIASPHNSELFETSTNIVTLTGYSLSGLTFSNIVVSGWLDRNPIGGTNDFGATTLLAADATDSRSPTTLGQMQAWLDDNEGKHWALWPALADIYLAGHTIISGTNGWTIGEVGRDLTISRQGHRVATFREATDPNPSPQIIQAGLSTNEATPNVFEMWVYVDGAATRPPEVAATESFTPPVSWVPYPTLTNSWPYTVAINGTNCYYIACAAPAASRFFRVFVERASTAPAMLSARSLSAGSAAIGTTNQSLAKLTVVGEAGIYTNSPLVSILRTPGAQGPAMLWGVLNADGSITTNATVSNAGQFTGSFAGSVTNGQPMSITLTNSTTLADGLLNGTNGVYFRRAGTNYWILL